MNIHWNKIVANNRVQYYSNIGGVPGKDSFGSHISIYRRQRGFDVEVTVINLMTRPWVTTHDSASFVTLRQAQTWSEIVLDEMLSARQMMKDVSERTH